MPLRKRARLTHPLFSPPTELVEYLLLGLDGLDGRSKHQVLNESISRPTVACISANAYVNGAPVFAVSGNGGPH